MPRAAQPLAGLPSVRLLRCDAQAGSAELGGQIKSSGGGTAPAAFISAVSDARYRVVAVEVVASLTALQAVTAQLGAVAGGPHADGGLVLERGGQNHEFLFSSFADQGGRF